MKKILFFVVLLGIILLLFLSQLEPKIIEIKNINEKMFGRFVKIRGEIIEAKEKNGFFVFEIKDESGKIKAIFKSKKNQIKKDMKIEVVGKVIEHNNILEIEARKIKIV